MRKREAPSGDLMENLRRHVSQPDSWKVYDCELVTPMYGGGVHAGEVDRHMPIRASAIRGQLRFWWRILQRKRFMMDGRLNSATMFKEETEIWGGIGSTGPKSSKVGVKVTTTSAPKCEAAFVFKPDKRLGNEGKYKAMPEPAPWAESYALFSAQGELGADKRAIAKAPKELALPGLAFKLAIKLDKKLSEQQRADIETALRWWASFGGVGARTRRGVGAIRIESIEPITADEVANQQGQLKLLNVEQSAPNAWRRAVSRLKDFRQGLNTGRNPPAAGSTSPSGRSRWPEADAIRALSHKACTRHQEPLVPGDVFPRAVFGLPIVFHFKDAGADGDPADHILEPANVSAEEKYDRMASPLILRPYWNGSAWQPAALLLPGWQTALSQRLKFKGQSYQPAHWPTDGTQRHKLAEKIQPMQTRGDDPLSAFMKFFSEGH